MTIVPVDVGCEPSPSLPAETLMQDGWCTYLLFFAVSKSGGDDGMLRDLGVAALEFSGCQITKFGYPNDEGRPEHALYNDGLACLGSSFGEVVASPWVDELEQMTRASAARIFSGQQRMAVSQAHRALRHFIVALKEGTFECIAEDVLVVGYFSTFGEATDYVLAKMREH